MFVFIGREMNQDFVRGHYGEEEGRIDIHTNRRPLLRSFLSTYTRWGVCVEFPDLPDLELRTPE